MLQQQVQLGQAGECYDDEMGGVLLRCGRRPASPAKLLRQIAAMFPGIPDWDAGAVLHLLVTHESLPVALAAKTHIADTYTDYAERFAQLQAEHDWTDDDQTETIAQSVPVDEWARQDRATALAAIEPTIAAVAARWQAQPEYYAQLADLERQAAEYNREGAARWPAQANGEPETRDWRHEGW